MGQRAELHLGWMPGQEAQVAEQLRAQLEPAGWQAVRALSMAVMALAESEAAGTLMVVVPAQDAERALKSLKVKAAGPPVRSE